MEEIHNIKYSIDSHTNQFLIHQVNNENAFVHVFQPGQEVFNESLNQYHQFPGVAASIIFPQLVLNTLVTVMIDHHSFFTLQLVKTCFNFHVCNRRFVFGNMPAALVNDDTKQRLRIGSPIFVDDKLVSVVTAFHRVGENAWLMPVTGIREPSQVSGHMKVPNGVRIEKWRPDMSIYGTVQLPYKEIKQHILDQEKGSVNTTLKDSCVLYYNTSEIRITQNRGDLEIMHLRLPGPLVQPHAAYYN